MKKYYYITPENEQRGPVEAAMLASCGVDSNTMVWTEGMANWQRAGDLPDLTFFILSTSTPPPFNPSQSQQQFDASQQQFGPTQQPNDPWQQQQNGSTQQSEGTFQSQQAYDASQQAYNPSGFGSQNNQGYAAAGNPFTNNASGNMPPIKPDNNMVWAILSTLCCCLPLGIVSIVYASRVNGFYYSGNYAAAQEAADKAKNWALYSLIGAIVANIIYYGLIFGLGLQHEFFNF